MSELIVASADLKEHLDYLKNLDCLLSKYQITLSMFIKLSRLEKFEIEDLNDFDYLEDKCQIWIEIFDIINVEADYEDTDYSTSIDEIAELLLNDNIPEVARIILDEELSLSEIKWYLKDSHLYKGDNLDELLLNVADHILGGL